MLIIGNKDFVNIAKRNMEGIVPLYYNMRKAGAVELNGENIFNGLSAAYTGGNIGVISNDITKIWNSDVWVNGTQEEKDEALLCVKLLCMENNFVIDYAKTLYKPIRPEHIDKMIKKYTKAKVPHFFLYAKDKEEGQVEDNNNTLVNRLETIIKDERFSFANSNFGKFDYTMLMKNKDIIVDDEVISLYKRVNSEYKNKLKKEDKYHGNEQFVYKTVKEIIECNFDYTSEEVADMLVKQLYHKTNSRAKDCLWYCYGDIVFENICRNMEERNVPKGFCLKCGCRFEKVGNQNTCIMCSGRKDTSNKEETKFITCIDCGNEVEIPLSAKRTCRCESCQKENRKRLDRARKLKKNK